MFTQADTKLVQWQDLKVMSEADLVLKIAQQNGWKDCEIFGHGGMITQPLESLGWKLIPADLFEYSIPAEGVDRILQIINTGVRIQGVIIADDTLRTNPPSTLSKPVVTLPSTRVVFSMLGKALLALAALAMVTLVGLSIAVGVFFLAPMILLCAAVSRDPKLIILVDDGNGETVWISVLTWFD